MQNSNIPALDGRYWAAIVVASVLGTTFGDFLSSDLGLGFAGALVPLAIIMAVIFLAESKTQRTTEAWYWAAIVFTRTAATDLGDFLSRSAQLGNGPASAMMAVLLVIYLVVTGRRNNDSRAIGAVKTLPRTNTRYWIGILMVSTLGTTLGDFTSNELGLGLGKASLVLGVILAVVLIVESRMRSSNETRYWAVIALVRTTGTVVGDYLTSKEGLGLGFALGASLVFIAFLAVLIIPKAYRSVKVS